MGKVVVAQGKDLIKTTVRINSNMEEIDPVTKKIIGSIDKPFVPTPEQIKSAQEKSAETAAAPSNGLEDIITQKLQEKIGTAIGDALSKMDLGDLISKAIDKALKPK